MQSASTHKSERHAPFVHSSSAAPWLTIIQNLGRRHTIWSKSVQTVRFRQPVTYLLSWCVWVPGYCIRMSMHEKFACICGANIPRTISISEVYYCQKTVEASTTITKWPVHSLRRLFLLTHPCRRPLKIVPFSLHFRKTTLKNFKCRHFDIITLTITEITTSYCLSVENKSSNS